MRTGHTLFLVPDLIGAPGGIARVCSLVCRALMEANKPTMTVALHDLNGASKRAAESFPRMAYVPCNGSRMRFVWQTFVAARKQKPALVFAAHPYFSYLTHVVARMVGARSAVMIHGLDAWETLSPLRRWGLRNVDMVISVSSFTARRASQANGLAPQKIRVLHNCIDPALMAPTNGNRAKGRPLLLTVARINREESKGHDRVIRALPELLKRFPALEYSIVGDGDGRQELENLVAREGVSNAVKFYGTVSETDLMRHYAEATIFIMPSRGEGFGLAFIEAMALGKPAIGGNLDAAPEVIIDGETGYVVDPGSSDEIVDRVSRLLSDQSLRQEMGRKAAFHVQTNFNYSTFKNRLLDYLFTKEQSRLSL